MNKKLGAGSLSMLFNKKYHRLVGRERLLSVSVRGQASQKDGISARLPTGRRDAPSPPGSSVGQGSQTAEATGRLGALPGDNHGADPADPFCSVPAGRESLSDSPGLDAARRRRGGSASTVGICRSVGLRSPAGWGGLGVRGALNSRGVSRLPSAGGPRLSGGRAGLATQGSVA